MFTEILGFIAGTLTTGSCLPQVYKVIKTGKTRDLSLIAYTILVVGCGLWVIYGSLIGSVALITTNVFSFLFLGTIWILILKNRIKHDD